MDSIIRLVEHYLVFLHLHREFFFCDVCVVVHIRINFELRRKDANLVKSKPLIKRL
jgi:hypothetical protein